MTSSKNSTTVISVTSGVCRSLEGDRLGSCSASVSRAVSSQDDSDDYIFNGPSELYALRARDINAFHKGLLNKNRSYSQYVMEMFKDRRYYAQHPYFRILVPYLVVISNFLSYALDPVNHSYIEASIPVVGDVYNIIFNKYHPSYLSAVKTAMWISGIIAGYFLGNLCHKYILNKLLRLNMFSDFNGSKIIILMSFCLSLYGIGHVYNVILHYTKTETRWKIDSSLDQPYLHVNQIVQTITWIGDFMTTFMVTDMMLQESLYPTFAPKIRTWWGRNSNRIKVFYASLLLMSPVVLYFIYIPDDSPLENYGMPLDLVEYGNDEVYRVLLSNIVLIMDLVIVMQDWDFPHFMNFLDLKLPGLDKSHVDVLIPKTSLFITVSARYLTYGILLVIIAIDMLNWYTHTTYHPKYYAQYYSPATNFIYTIKDKFSLDNYKNATLISFEFRSSSINPLTNRLYIEGDTQLYVKFVDYSRMHTILIGVIPLVVSAFILIYLVMKYGRYPTPTPENPYIGRMRLIHRRVSVLSVRRKSVCKSQSGQQIRWKTDSGSVVDVLELESDT